MVVQAGGAVLQLLQDEGVLAVEDEGHPDAPERAQLAGLVDVAGSSIGARMVLEMARRGHPGATVALAPPCRPA